MSRDNGAPPANELCTPAGLADRWDTTVDSLAQRRYRGEGPPYLKIGRKVMYRLTDVRAFEEAHRVVEA